MCDIHYQTILQSRLFQCYMCRFLFRQLLNKYFHLHNFSMPFHAIFATPDTMIICLPYPISLFSLLIKILILILQI